jgi:hypothetical protein
LPIKIRNLKLNNPQYTAEIFADAKEKYLLATQWAFLATFSQGTLFKKHFKNNIKAAKILY